MSVYMASNPAQSNIVEQQKKALAYRYFLFGQATLIAIFLPIMWAAILVRENEFTKNSLNESVFWLSLIFVTVCLLNLCLLSFKISPINNASNIEDINNLNKKAYKYTISTTLICCYLIWLTGGISSPIMPFYGIVFAFAYKECPEDKKLIMTLFFIVSISIALTLSSKNFMEKFCIFPSFMLSPLPSDHSIHLTPAKRWIEFGGIVVSLLMPKLGDILAAKLLKPIS